MVTLTPTYEGDNIVFESESIRIIIEPKNSGRIRSLTSKKSGINYLYVDSRKEWRGPGYSDYDISGYTECFPSVGPCTYPDGDRQGMEMGDHGWLWQSGWEAKIEGDRVMMSKDVPQFDCRFERSCCLDGRNSLRLEYVLKNHGDKPLKFIYSAHPLLYARPDTRLELPKEMEKAYIAINRNVPGLVDNSWASWPPSDETTLNGDLDPARCSMVKMFSPKLSSGKAAIRHGDVDESLEFEFDTGALPYLGVLYSQGFDFQPDGHFRNELFLGLEPTTGIGDDLPTCDLTNTVQILMPGQELRFWITLSLRP
ncbi:MAG: aldose epimerase family protein [Armatimonadota bacterium]